MQQIRPGRNSWNWRSELDFCFERRH